MRALTTVAEMNLHERMLANAEGVPFSPPNWFHTPYDLVRQPVRICLHQHDEKCAVCVEYDTQRSEYSRAQMRRLGAWRRACVELLRDAEELR